MGKSSVRTQHYRPGTSRKVVSLSTFREQMADFARAERLLELRTTRHLSREKLANEIGVSTKSVYAWENGGGIKWTNAERLGAFYGVDPRGLVTHEADETDAPESPTDIQPTSQLDRIEAKLDALVNAVGADLSELRGVLAGLATDSLRHTRELQEHRDKDHRTGSAGGDAQ